MTENIKEEETKHGSGIEAKVLMPPPARPRPKVMLIHFTYGHSESSTGTFLSERLLTEREDGAYDYPYLCDDCYSQTRWKRFKEMLDLISAKAAAVG